MSGYCSTVQYSGSRNIVEAYILVEHCSTHSTVLVEVISPGGAVLGLVECCSTVQHYTLLLLVEYSVW